MGQVLEQIKNRRSIRKYKPDEVPQEPGLGSCWINRAKEELDTSWGKDLLKSLGIEDEYEGIGHCALGCIDGEVPEAAPRNENRVFYIK